MQPSIIRNRKRITQFVNFEGMVFRNKISPMDIDGCIEYKDRIRILFELKVKGNFMSYGQKLTYERFTKDFVRAGKKAIFFLCVHEAPADQDIMAKDSTILSYYMNGKWNLAKRKINLMDAINRFLDSAEPPERIAEKPTSRQLEFFDKEQK